MSGIVRKKIFIHCKKCKKRLIERLPNGMWRFVFGKSPKDEDSAKGPPVEMLIHGSLKIKCIRRNCGEWNTLNYFPPSFKMVQSVQSEDASLTTKNSNLGG